MRAELFDLPAGQSLPSVRDFVRRHRELCSRQDVIRHFGSDIADELVAKGLLEPSGAYFEISLLAIRLRHVRFIKRLPRAKAEQIVAEMLERARAINADEALMYSIKKIEVFGSFIQDTPDLGDIDLGVELQRKPIEGEYLAAVKARARASGRDWSSVAYPTFLEWPRTEVLRRLKNRNRYISFITDYDTLDTPKRVIFEAAP